MKNIYLEYFFSILEIKLELLHIIQCVICILNALRGLDISEMLNCMSVSFVQCVFS